MSEHFWEKWNSYAEPTARGAAERFYAELSDNYRRLLVERACLLYDGKRDLPNIQVKVSRPDDSAEVSEMLLYLGEKLRMNNGEFDLTDDSGQPMVLDAEKNVYIPDITLSLDNIPCAVVPLRYFDDDTIRAIVNIVSL